MKKIIILVTIVLPLFVFSQNLGGSAMYKLKLAFDDDAMKVDKKYGLLQQALDACDKMEYQLVFQKNESNFFQVKNENLDKASVRMANIMANTSQMIYQNLDKKIILNEIFPIQYLIEANEVVLKDTINGDWEISSESKLIDSYLCYKAILKKSITINNKILNESAVAWFCPSLPYSFGPASYGGLPGLILELREKNVAFILKSFTQNHSSSNIIKIPTAKKSISKSEFNELLNNRRQSLMEMAKQR